MYTTRLAQCFIDQVIYVPVGCSVNVYQVVETDRIAWDAHLLPIFGSDRVPEGFSHHSSLDSFNSFFVNHYVDHHTHELLTV
jgi:hypothetical protein